MYRLLQCPTIFPFVSREVQKITLIRIRHITIEYRDYKHFDDTGYLSELANAFNLDVLTEYDDPNIVLDKIYDLIVSGT